MDASPIRQPSAVIPIAMSLTALAAVLYHLARFGPAPQPDEGAAAHLWQLLMAGQVPVIIFYAARWLPRSPGPAAAVLAAQAAAALAAAAPVFLLGW
jgi:hypothetical protein